jgi:RES domain-containing protein
MYVWRICSKKYRDMAFSGIGGLCTQSRWLPKGYPVVYTAESLALASLEVFVHTTESSSIPSVAIRALIQDNIAIEAIDLNILPPNWQEESAYPQLQAIGEEWIKSQRTPILKVPSAIIPVEFNYILNPEHPDLEFQCDLEMDFKFDRRMWKSSN